MNDEIRDALCSSTANISGLAASFTQQLFACSHGASAGGIAAIPAAIASGPAAETVMIGGMLLGCGVGLEANKHNAIETNNVTRDFVNHKCQSMLSK